MFGRLVDERRSLSDAGEEARTIQPDGHRPGHQTATDYLTGRVMPARPVQTLVEINHPHRPQHQHDEQGEGD